MRASPKARALAKGYEGWSATPYLCPGGMWTIGWGHTRGVTANTPPITEAEGKLYLSEDVAAAEAIVSHAVTVTLNQNEFDALVSFCFNVGLGNFETSTMFKMLKAGNKRF